jgi:hypothetical protein
MPLKRNPQKKGLGFLSLTLLLALERCGQREHNEKLGG